MLLRYSKGNVPVLSRILDSWPRCGSGKAIGAVLLQPGGSLRKMGASFFVIQNQAPPAQFRHQPADRPHPGHLPVSYP